MVRAGCASSSLSKNNRSMSAALREKMLKFTPPSTTVAPSGALRPAVVVLGSSGLTRAEVSITRRLKPGVTNVFRDGTLSEFIAVPQGGSFLAILGLMIQSLRD